MYFQRERAYESRHWRVNIELFSPQLDVYFQTKGINDTILNFGRNRTTVSVLLPCIVIPLYALTRISSFLVVNILRLTRIRSQNVSYVWSGPVKAKRRRQWRRRGKISSLIYIMVSTKLPLPFDIHYILKCILLYMQIHYK